MQKLILLLLVGVAVSGCGTRNIRPGDVPNPEDGLAFVRVRISGTEQAYTHIFVAGDRAGPHRARITSNAGESVYAVFLPPGRYDVGQITVGSGTDIWKNFTCPSFVVTKGQSAFANSIDLSVNYPKYNISCTRSQPDFESASTKFRSAFPDLATRLPVRFE